ncbi:STAS domain-containing protein [Micromonospora psammae]|uniref:STAS domain-containing protein n=1 Tax=Micromonospora sp. CPCC 205556 TaxID=3122398 RepID=UPI002FF1A330
MTDPQRPPGRDVRVVNATGEIDLETAPALRAALTAAVREHPWVCCDLSGVTFCCAAGVNVLIEVANEAARVGHRFDVRGARGGTARVLDITGAGVLLTGGSARWTGQQATRPTDRSAAPDLGQPPEVVSAA